MMEQGASEGQHKPGRLVVGAGKSGVAAANFLAGRGHSVTLADSKSDPELPYALDERVLRAFGTSDAALLDGIAEVIVSPGVPMSAPLLAAASGRAIPLIGEIELAYRYLKGRIVAVTGSNGKSTTTALIGEILRIAGHQPVVAGNIGDPLIAALDHERPRTYVIELSSFQLETVDTFRADVALLLNVTPDHMDRYSSFDSYAAAKHRIFRNQRSGDVSITNVSDRRGARRDTGSRLWRFSTSGPVDDGAYLDGTDLVLRVSGLARRIPRAALKLEGLANVENALAAWLAARAMGVDDLDVQIAFGSFAGLPHRMVLVRERAGVRWINDSKGTNVDATLRSLEGFPDASVIVIMGGKDKSGEFERMRELVSKKARAVITIGSAAERIATAIEGCTEVVAGGDMRKAVEWAAEHAGKGESVLLSPACASFDQYRNFEHRGDHFEELVRGLNVEE